MSRLAAVVSLALLAVLPSLQARTLCTVVADAKSGSVLFQEGDCDKRFTPASTFKIPLSLMGFDSGFLQDAHSPVLQFRPGDVDWGGDDWRRPIDPTSWMKHSVVWFSQRMARFLGPQRLHRYAVAFGYGNADFAGDPGKDNGLERGWISSSLKVSPLEQVRFLARLVNRELPVSASALDETLRLVERGGVADGWEIHGKTGFAYPRRVDGEFDEDRPWGWYVGWASKGGRTLVFARLIQDDAKTSGIASWRSRDELIGAFPSLVGPPSR